MKAKLLGFSLIILILSASCQSGSGKSEGPTRQGNSAFDPARVSQQHHEATRDEVRLFVGEVNRIIRSRNYSAWRSVLTPEFIAEYSSKEKLDEINESPVLRQNKIVLNSMEDYFRHVVVPSRASVSERVDDIDIEFVTEYRVRAFSLAKTRSGEEQKTYLYDLEKIGNSWKIMK